MKNPLCEENFGLGESRPCTHQAQFLVVAVFAKPRLVCGIHARRWLPKALRGLTPVEARK